MSLEGLLISFFVGVLGGLLASGLRLLHLEMEWAQVRKDLRRYYSQMRADRAREIEPRPAARAPLSADEVYEAARRKGLTFDAFSRRLQRE